MQSSSIADALNLLGDFCAQRDVPALTRDALRARYGFETADLLVLVGGVIPHACEVAAAGWNNGVARRFVTVGGAGHTTPAFRERMRAGCPQLAVEGRAEADILADYLALRHGIPVSLRENRSTNSGENADFLLALLEEAGLAHRSMIVLQDSTMQRRMAATLRKRTDDTVIHFAPYRARVMVGPDGALRYTETLWGMWSIEEYAALLLGEIARLRDDENGYGPNGRGYIAHEDIPEAVLAAYALLREAGFGGDRI